MIKNVKLKTNIMHMYYSLEDMLGMIEQPNQDRCIEFLQKESDIITKATGSKTKHQIWEGGYIDHVKETMNLAILLYESLASTGRILPFKISDALLVMFLHDLEKPFKQIRGKELGLINAEGIKDDPKIKTYREELIKKYNFSLEDMHLKAIKSVEGENENYHPTERVMNELGAFCHMCDVASARIWYDYPKK